MAAVVMTNCTASTLAFCGDTNDTGSNFGKSNSAVMSAICRFMVSGSVMVDALSWFMPLLSSPAPPASWPAPPASWFAPDSSWP